MKRPIATNEKGFTIVELMIATLVFSVILVAITVGVLSFTNAYYRGVNTSTTQNTARNAMDTITQAIQFSPDKVNDTLTSSGLTYFCAGGKIFITRAGALYQGTTNSATPGLYEQPNSSGCTLAPAYLTFTNGKQLLSSKMRITTLSVSTTANTQMSTVNMLVAYGDDDLLTALTGNNVTCKIQAGSQFCAVAPLSSTVARRLEK